MRYFYHCYQLVLLWQRYIVIIGVLMFASLFHGIALGQEPSQIKLNTKQGQALQKFLNHYLEIARANYHDVTTTAKLLRSQVISFLAAPSEKTLSDVKAAYRTARMYYQQSEVFRYAHPEVDDLEGRVNAWPLDEGFIDYVHSDGDSAAHTYLISLSALNLGQQTIKL
ncbi:MAG: hypothetical protein OXC40_04645, partial [Proteobacteria bacterium]|nr:hypothetical protein [Pseudomonadota bacterium]